MKSAIVAGANGFLGAALTAQLLKLGMQVYAVYNDQSSNIDKKAILYKTADIFTSGVSPDYIFFVVGNYSNTHNQLLKINNDLYRYIQVFPNARIIYISSTNVYGAHIDTITENSAYINPGLYASSKLAGEFIVSAALSFAILRMTYIYGPGISNNSFIPFIINSAKQGSITLFGKGERTQDYIYIEDAVAMCIAAAKLAENEILLCATGISVSNKMVAEALAGIIGCEINYTGVETGQSFIFNPTVSLEKLGCFPKMSIIDGLKSML